MDSHRPSTPPPALEGTVELRLARDLNALGGLRQTLASVCTGLPEEFTQMLTLASQESATNVIRHANVPPGGRADIGVTLRRDKTCVEVEFIHGGELFSPTSEATPDFSGERDGGFGLYIIQNAVDEVTYDSPAPGLARVRLRKNLPE